MWFDPTAKLAVLKTERLLRATPATPATQTPEKAPRVAEVAEVARSRGANAKTDPDGVARTPEAIEAVWSAATRRAVEFRKTQKPPTCAACNQSDWTVSITTPDGRKLHVQCWRAAQAAPGGAAVIGFNQ